MYANVNDKFGRAWWDYDGLMVAWGVQDNYEVVRKVGRGKVSMVYSLPVPTWGPPQERKSVCSEREGSVGSATRAGRQQRRNEHMLSRAESTSSCMAAAVCSRKASVGLNYGRR